MRRIHVSREAALACAGLFVLSLALYGRAVRFGFVNFDDRAVLLAHPNLYDERSFGSSLAQILLHYFPREEPLLLRDVTWAVDSRLFGFENPAGYHLGNVLLNAFNVGLLFLFLRRVTRRPRTALLVAGLFALLPVHVEPVCWVMGRKDVLVSFWMLLALEAQARELEHPDPGARRTLYLATLLFHALALLSKMSAVSFFVVLGAHRGLAPYLDGSRPPDRPLEVRRALREVLPPMLPHLLLSLAVFAWFQRIIAAYGVIGWRGPAPWDPEHLAMLARFVPLVIALYLRSLLWPAQLSVFYRWPHVEIPLPPLELASSAGFALALLGFTIWCCLRRRDLAFYLLAFLALLLPYLNVVYIGIWRADRYLYLASFCILAIAVSLFSGLHARGGRVLRAGLVVGPAVFALLCTARTLRQQGVWHDNRSLWLHEAHLEPPSLLALQALAKSTLEGAEAETDPGARERLLDRARGEIERGLRSARAPAPGSTRYRTPDRLHLARLHMLRGRLAELEGEPLEVRLAHYSTAWEIAPDRSSALRLARVCFELGLARPPGEQEPCIRRSFAYFLEFVRFSRRDPILLRRSLTMLRVNYEQRFPFLAPEVARAKRTWFP